MNRLLVGWLTSAAGRPFEVVLGLVVFPLGLLFLFGAVRGLLEDQALETLLIALFAGGLGWFFSVVGLRLLRGRSGRSDGGLLPPWLLMVAGALFLMGLCASWVGGKATILLGLGVASLAVGAMRQGRRDRDACGAGSKRT